MFLTPNPSWLRGADYDLGCRRHRLDGCRVPSVTQTLDLAYPMRFVDVPREFLERKAAIGTAVHHAAHYHAEGDLLEASLGPEVQPRFAAWRWFCETRRVDPILCETVVCSRDLGLPMARRRPYIGKLDLLCIVDGRRVVLLDLKIGMPSLARMQTLAYLDALYQQYPQLIAIDVERWAVVLDADGRYRVHAFRDDSGDAGDYREALERAYDASEMDWRRPMADTQHPVELPIELPDEDPLPGMFDLPEDLGPPTSPTSPGPFFEMPPEDSPSSPAAAAAEVLAAEPPAVHELMITPDIEAYLSMIEAAIEPFEATAKAFAEQMASAPVATPQELAALGEQSLFAKEREKLLDALFEPAIRKPRLYLDRVYAVKRRMVEWWRVGGATAARRYTARKRELAEADRRAQAEADRQQREAQHEARRQAAEERRRLTQEAATAAQQGNAAAAADLIEQARAVEPPPVQTESAPTPLTPPAAVPGLTERGSWTADISDMKTAILAAARPDIFREVAEMVGSGDLTPAGATGLATNAISQRLRAIASELPIIPSTMFAANLSELKARAVADRDTLSWPGFQFKQTFTPVRRPRAQR
jgi:hypothetical protein